MSTSDQFGSSDEDDEDEGWLSQSTFGLTNPPIGRSFADRRPLSSGFDVSTPSFPPRHSPDHSLQCGQDSFDPSGSTSLSMSQDPFNPQDDVRILSAVFSA